MNLRILTLVLPAVLIMLATGCSKDDPGGSNVCSLSDSALVGNYKITAATYQADAQSPVEDWYNSPDWDSCRKKIVIQFYSSGEYYELFSPGCEDAPCDIFSGGICEGTWSITGNSLLLVSQDSLDARQYPVISFDCDSFKTKYVTSFGEIYTRTYSRQ